MAEITKAAFNTTYADASGVFADNTTGLISEGDLRAFATDIKDSLAFNLDGAIKRIKVTVSSASLLTLGTVPVTIIAAPGANKYLNIININYSYNYGSAPYDFTGKNPVFKIGSNTVAGILDSTISVSADFNARALTVEDLSSGTSIYVTNTALTFTTTPGTNPAGSGDGDLDIVVYYSIEDVNV